MEIVIKCDEKNIYYSLRPRFIVTFSYGTGFKELVECVINEVRGGVCNKLKREHIFWSTNFAKLSF